MNQPTTRPRLTARQARKQGTIRKIEIAARKLFSANGYEDVGIRDVADAIGMSTGAVFAHFVDKAGLYLAAIGVPAPGDRDQRQACVADWCASAFGREQAADLGQRGLRHAEEAIEAYQSAADLAGVPAAVARAKAHELVDHIFRNPPGELGQEVGGSGLTLLALAEAAGHSADLEERREVARVLAKPLSHFAERNARKNALGFDITKGGEKAA